MSLLQIRIHFRHSKFNHCSDEKFIFLINKKQLAFRIRIPTKISTISIFFSRCDVISIPKVHNNLHVNVVTVKLRGLTLVTN